MSTPYHTARQLATVFLLVGILEYTTCQTCSQVYTEISHCASMGAVEISCPSGYYVDVLEAAPRALREPGCSTALEDARDACTIEPLTDYVRQILCYQTTACTVPTSLFATISLSRCSDYVGENVLHYKYRCIPISQQQESICRGDTWMLSSIQIGPNPLAFYGILGNSFIHSTDCACAISLPADMQLTLKRTLFSVSPFAFTCEQRVVVSDEQGTVLASMCLTSDTLATLDCAPHNRTIYMTYETLNSDVMATFIVDAYVDHTNSIEVQCGLNYNRPTVQPTLSYTTPGTTTMSSYTTPGTTPVSSYTTPGTAPVSEYTTPSSTTTTTATTTTATTTTTTTETVTTPSTTSTTTQRTPSTTEAAPVTSATRSEATSTILSTLSATVTEEPDETTANSTDLDAGESSDNFMFGITREMFIGAIVGGLAFIMVISAAIVIARAHRSNRDTDGDTPSTTNIAENFYEEPDYPYCEPFDPPSAPPIAPKSPPRITDGIYSTLPSVNYAKYDHPRSNSNAFLVDDEPDIAHNPLYGRSSELFNY